MMKTDKRAYATQVLTRAKWVQEYYTTKNGIQRSRLTAKYNGQDVELRDASYFLFIDGRRYFNVGGLEDYEALFYAFYP